METDRTGGALTNRFQDMLDDLHRDGPFGIAAWKTEFGKSFKVNDPRMDLRRSPLKVTVDSARVECNGFDRIRMTG